MDEKELQAAAQIAAPLVNRIVANGTPAGLRLAFGEQLTPTTGTIFRAGVLLSYDDAVALRNLIDQQLAARLAKPPVTL